MHFFLQDGWGDQEVRLPWGEDDMLQVPTPVRKSSSVNHETGLSPTEGFANQGDMQSLCTMCSHEDKSMECQACGHVACSICMEKVSDGGVQWRLLCPCCKERTKGARDVLTTQNPEVGIRDQDDSPGSHDTVDTCDTRMYIG